MLTVQDLKKLRSKDRDDHGKGTKLVITHNLNYPLKEGVEVEFCSFNYIGSATGEHKLSHKSGFGRAGGARCWDDFSARGRQWIGDHFDPEQSELIVIVGRDDVHGIKASRVRLA